MEEVEVREGAPRLPEIWEISNVLIRCISNNADNLRFRASCSAWNELTVIKGLRSLIGMKGSNKQKIPSSGSGTLT
jgi:hypothetical protein